MIKSVGILLEALIEKEYNREILYLLIKEGNFHKYLIDIIQWEIPILQ